MALMDEKGEAFYYKKHLFTQSNSAVQIITNQKPAKAGIDPYSSLIDREMDDNVCEVKEAKDDSLVTFLINVPVKSAMEEVFSH
ncbi:MAG: hypothetical protein MZU84_00920 [Sphingobacterium sp.]|nr:hypothetical protein [Sphingobacterium sp.]